MSLKAFDCQTPVTGEMIDASKRSGGVGWLRYYYNLTAPEVARILAAGQGVAMIHENDGREVVDPSRGWVDALQVNIAQDRLGFPRESWSWYTGDLDIQPWQFPNVAAYMANTHGWYFPPGASVRSLTRAPAFYGGEDVGEYLFHVGASMGTWIAAASSWSRGHYWDTDAHDKLRQHAEASPIPATDWNEVLWMFFGQWDPTRPIPGGIEMTDLTLELLQEELTHKDARDAAAMLRIHAETGVWMQDQARNVVLALNATMTAATEQILSHLAPAGAALDTGAVRAAVSEAVADALKATTLRTVFEPSAKTTDALTQASPEAA